MAEHRTFTTVSFDGLIYVPSREYHIDPIERAFEVASPGSDHRVNALERLVKRVPDLELEQARFDPRTEAFSNGTLAESYASLSAAGAYVPYEQAEDYVLIASVKALASRSLFEVEGIIIEFSMDNDSIAYHYVSHDAVGNPSKLVQASQDLEQLTSIDERFGIEVKKYALGPEKVHGTSLLMKLNGLTAFDPEGSDGSIEA